MMQLGMGWCIPGVPIVPSPTLDHRLQHTHTTHTQQTSTPAHRALYNSTASGVAEGTATTGKMFQHAAFSFLLSLLRYAPTLSLMAAVAFSKTSSGTMSAEKPNRSLYLHTSTPMNAYEYMLMVEGERRKREEREREGVKDG